MPKRKTPSSTPTSRGTATPTTDAAQTMRPDVQLRRSSRRLTQKDHEFDEQQTRDIQGKIMGFSHANQDEMDADEFADKKGAMQEGVQLAIEGLGRLERRLRSATKKQKRKVQESDIDIPKNLHAEQPFLPRPTRDITDSLPAMKKDQDKQEANKENKGPVGANQAESRGVEPLETAPDAPERGAARAPPVNSGYLPLPWKGRLGYACLNTYLRCAKPAVFNSRTCRMASIIDHRYPLQDTSQPEHYLKNRPDKSKDPDKDLGRKFVQDLGLANVRDIVKILRWNDKYGIKLFRLSSEMFPFASHEEHGYKLAPFASEVLAETGRVAAELGHRLTTHPGQFTQLGSPRKEVVTAAVRDLEYHDEMLSLLRLPEQQNRDAVMIIHMGGVYGDKAATLDRFWDNYTKLLSDSIKRRLVLENDDVAWSVHDLLPICEKLNIPLVLDYHHHNIIFDSSKCREGTYDISQPEIMDRIAATWKRKGITQKMHYSEPCAGAVTPRDRRKHSPRVMTLPPCPPTMDLMIEAKDKEQAVFELMRTFKLPGFEKIRDVIPYERDDENRPAPKGPTKNRKKNGGGVVKRKRAPDEHAIDMDAVGAGADDTSDETPKPAKSLSEEDFAMGGPENRVYWPPGFEEWLRPKKREIKKGKVPPDAIGDGELDDEETC
ncbi:UV-endonuclease UvdE-domain-containing protein [Apodospora peruviana]|uniref:UV-endonuclease UvdE-domain-containing protein n=1 Tax=Apodospora peruviana TaxID=516989 RepID=A0AAE0IHN0_9PEZI|nr:UV-endonuclease UvdE-domain-containing protein [Apodospora peruviana]